MKKMHARLGVGAVKSGFGALALALGLVACGDEGSANGPSNNHEGSNVSSVTSEDDLPSCTESRDGSVNFVDGTKEGFVCKDHKWHRYDMLADFEENLPGCTESREGLTAYLYEKKRELKCVDGVWEKNDEEARSSSSVIPSSSSSGIPGTDPGSPSSSSVIPSSSSEESSSSVTSSSSVASSSSARSSSSVASSSSAKSSSSKANWAYLNPSIDYDSMIDTRDGQVYKTVTIGTQTWMAENLNYNPGDVSSMGSYAWSGCYNNNADSCAKYGRLYTWEVAMNDANCAYGNSCHPSGTVQGVCPSGWHLPTKEEWQQLVKPMAYSVDDYTTYWLYNGAGVELKTIDGWSYYTDITADTNASGFSALPAGFRDIGGDFNYSGNYAGFWSASEYNDGSAYYLYLGYDGDRVLLEYYTKRNAYSVRCVQNN